MTLNGEKVNNHRRNICFILIVFVCFFYKVWRDTNSPHIIYKVSTAQYKLNRDSVNKVVCSINGTNEQVIDIYFHDQNSKYRAFSFKVLHYWKCTEF